MQASPSCARDSLYCGTCYTTIHPYRHSWPTVAPSGHMLTGAPREKRVVHHRTQLTRGERTSDKGRRVNCEDSGVKFFGSAGGQGFSYLFSCTASVHRLWATSAQASTAPCRVCRSGLRVIDSRRGKTVRTGEEMSQECTQGTLGGSRTQDPKRETPPGLNLMSQAGLRPGTQASAEEPD